MIKRFNFYDIYGYLLPGGAALGLFWLSFSLNALRVLPEVSLAAAIVGVAAAYMVGHVLQTIAKQILPSERRINGEYRLPSDFILDDPTFPPRLRALLRARIHVTFELNIDNRPDRGQAFFLCRDLLVQKNLGAYAEQFQGMYALMRGIAIACLLAVFYQIGLVLAMFVVKDWVRTAALVSAAVVIGWSALAGGPVKSPGERSGLAGFLGLAPPKSARERLTFAVFLGLAPMLVGVGATSGCTIKEHWTRLLVLVAATWFIGWRTYQAGPEFARKFAETVYRCFVMMDLAGMTTVSAPDEEGGFDLDEKL